MTTKTERLYTALLPMKVVNFDDIEEAAQTIIGKDVDRRYIYRKYVDRLVDKGRLRRVRRGIYVVLSPIEGIEGYSMDKFLIASKIKDRYYLGFHTALEFYGCAHSLYNEVYLSVKEGDRFDTFKFQGVRFRPVFVTDVDTEVEKKAYNNAVLRVSSKERTFIDCIDRVQYAGGWEECLKSLEGLSGLDFKRLLSLLQEYKKDILFRRVGYILELLKKHSVFYEHMEEHILEDIEEYATETPRYLIRGKSGPLNSRWNLYIPEDFEAVIRGI